MKNDKITTVKHFSRIMCMAAVCLLLCLSCGDNKKPNQLIEESEEKKTSTNQFEPDNGKCLVFIGQDLGAVGGLDDYTDGYCNYFETPAGVTVYFGVNDGATPIGGMDAKDNWGSGDCWADKYLDASRFDNTMIAIGLHIVGSEQLISSGKKNEGLTRIGRWLKNMAPRPVFLRIGYEFDLQGNHYTPETYISAFRFIVTFFNNMGVDNVAYVWQSTGSLSAQDHAKWYPGNEYVDWCAYSHFGGSPGKNMIDFARSKGKPVFIAEATPVFQNSDDDADIKKPEVAQRMWNEWFIPFFRVIEDNPDTVKAFSYINVDWYAQPLWTSNTVFRKCDSRIQKSDYVSLNWRTKMTGNRYVNADNLDWDAIRH